MIEGLYKAASGLEAYTRNQEIIASNLANANTIGFKRNILDFKTVLDKENAVEGSENIKTEVGIDFSKGNLEFTGSNFNMAIEGKGFFTIETEQGLRFTRDGRFQLSENGEMVTTTGGRLLGTGGPIILPGNSSEVKVDSTGSISVDNAVVGDLMISNFKLLSLLVPTGNSLFMAPPAAGQEEDVESRIVQGYLEKSNVDVVMEMVRMIENMRGHEVSSRIIKVFGDTIERFIRSQA